MSKRIVEVIEARHWKNARTGQTASIYSACPWTTEAERADWQIVTRGFTWRLEDGTIGLGRLPAATREEAEAVMRAQHARPAR